MKLRRLSIANFRGFESFELQPRGHVFLVGQPGAGRSDVVEAIWRVLSPDSARYSLADDLDFYQRDRTRRIEIEAVVGDLGQELEQLFLDRLEVWNPDEGRLIGELDPESPRTEDLEYVVRFCYRARWEEDQQQAAHWVDFPKFSDPQAEQFVRVSRLLREALPFTLISAGGPVLSLASRGDLRRLVDSGETGDFSRTLDELLEGTAALAEGLSASKDLEDVLQGVLQPLRAPLNLGDREISDIIRFAPEGASLSGLLRSLAPIVKLREELGFLPLSRHGSTLSGMLALARAISQAESGGAVVAIDDYGEAVDPLAARHLATTLRQKASQLWLASKSGELGRSFRTDEIVRLTVDHDGRRRTHLAPVPSTRAERIAARSLHVQLLPAVSARALLILEGPHDRVALEQASMSRDAAIDVPLPAARRIALVDAGIADSAGGITAIPRLAELARHLGFFVMALVDWDTKADEAAARLAAVEASVDVVIRWPKGHAIEKALVADVDLDHVRNALGEVAAAAGLNLDFDLNNDTRLRRNAIRVLKSSGGLHALYLDALPEGVCPPLVHRALEAAIQAVGRTGVIQL